MTKKPLTKVLSDWEDTTHSIIVAGDEMARRLRKLGEEYRIATAIRAVLEENRQLQADKAALISSKIVGPKDLMEENERLRAEVAGARREWDDEIRFHKGTTARIDAELARHKPCHAGAEAPWCPACANNPTAPCPTAKILRGKP